MAGAPLGLRLMLAEFIGAAYRSSRPVRIVQSPGDLPPALEHVAVDAEVRKRAWFAWIDDEQTRFVAGEVTRPIDNGGREMHALRTFFHDDEGRLLASAAWTRDAEGHWRLWDR